MGQYKPMPKMKTTEPSVELKLKKGGKVKKMMDGGLPMAAAAPAMRRAPRTPQAVPVRPTRAPVLRAKGGKMESLREIEAHERNEKEELGRVKKELKQHEAMKASKAHRGLKKGGMAPKAGPNVVGGLAGGLEATRANKKSKSGNIELSKYKKGGAIAAKGMKLAEKYQTKINDASRSKSVKGGTGGVSNTMAGGRPAGFKSGGAINAKGMALARKYQTKINDASSSKAVKGGTGGIELSKFKSGGHAAMKCHSTGGFTAMKKMSKC